MSKKKRVLLIGDVLTHVAYSHPIPISKAEVKLCIWEIMQKMPSWLNLVGDASDVIVGLSGFEGDDLKLIKEGDYMSIDKGVKVMDVVSKIKSI